MFNPLELFVDVQINTLVAISLEYHLDSLLVLFLIGFWVLGHHSG